jgi:hypothetical protein
MAELEQITRTVTLVDLVMGDPPAIITRERLVGRGGRTRTFTQKITVPDQELFRRVRERTAKGDEIEITTVTDWSATELPTFLTDFAVAKRDPDWQARWESAVAEIRSGIPPGITPEEIEADITAAREEFRRERRARGR